MAWSLGGAKTPLPPLPSNQTPISSIHQNTYGFPKTLTGSPLSPKILTTPLPPFLLKSW